MSRTRPAERTPGATSSRSSEAATECLGRSPDATLADIAGAAGVGRITLYGHFSSRAELLDAVMQHVLEQGDAVLEPVDLTGDPRQALARLIEASWEVLDRSRSILMAAQKDSPPPDPGAAPRAGS